MAVKINGSTGIELEDNDKQIFGTGDDLQIYYSGSDGFIKQPVGIMWTETPAWCVTSATGSEYMARFDENGSCKLYYDNSAKIETISTGINVTGGIRVGGNNTANEMDDYEEGTWTPTFLSNGGTDPSCTYGTRYGKYTKVGNVVFFAFNFSDVDIANHGSSNACVGGLPFTAASGDSPGYFNSIYHVAGSKFSSDDVVGLYVRAGETKASLIKQTGSQVTFQTNHNDYAFGGSGIYYV